MPTIYGPNGQSKWVATQDVAIWTDQGWSLTKPKPKPKEKVIPGPPGPGSVEFGQVGQIPGTVTNRDVWIINGQMYLVYQAPTAWTTDAMGNVTVTATAPIAYACSAADLVAAGIAASVEAVNLLVRDTLTVNEWGQMGGLVVGDIGELNNPDDDPFEYIAGQMEENAVLYPWLLDPEIMALTAAAWLEGRSLSEGELAGTNWWQSHSDTERDWLVQNSQNPTGAAALLTDNRIMVLELLQSAGVNNAPDTLVNLLADNYTRGTWTQVYLNNQIDLLSDPTKRGSLDTAVSDHLSGIDNFALDTTQARRDRVTELAYQWLGPAMGKMSPADLDRWAGRLRNDPDAEQALINQLQRQRMTFFPAYTDPTATYDDIAGPWRNLVMQVWGQEADETDNMFLDIVRGNDIDDATRVLREQGIRRGVGNVVDDLLADLYSSFGGGVVRAQ